MCSIGEDDYGDEGGVHAMVPDASNISSTIGARGTCTKCYKIDQEIYKLKFREPECRECFLSYVRHKFRAVLGSSKVLTRNANILLVFDGSAEAIALLDMMHHAKTVENNFKRLRCDKVTVLHIDERPILTLKDNKKSFKDFDNFLKNYKEFESFIVPITATTKTHDTIPTSFTDIDDYLGRDLSNQQTFLERLENIRSLTARQDFVKQHRIHLINNAAKQLCCNYVFMPDISNSLAAALITSVALGRGGSAAFDAALLDERLAEGIKLVRPLRNLNVLEVQLYLRAQNQQALIAAESMYGVGSSATSSLQNLTTAFVENLQQNFSATVSTIFRCGDKIAPNHEIQHQLDSLSLEDNNSAWCCSFCRSPLDYKNSNTLLATEFSRVVSEMGTDADIALKVEEKARRNLMAQNNPVSDIQEQQVNAELRQLCHACRNILRESKSKTLEL